jgi:RPA family protein
MNREPAWRIFAAEYNNSRYEIKGEEQKTPSYLISPLGAKINRIYFVGVLTDAENISEGGDFIRSHVSDPTGVFTIYSGQYQPETTQALTNIDVPAYVAVVGKTRTYEPEEGELFISVRPELIREIKPETRDRWILETYQHTKNRLEATTEAQKMTTATVKELKSLGYSQRLSEGLLLAKEHYQSIDINRYTSILQDALDYVIPNKETEPTTPITEDKPIPPPTPIKQTKSTEEKKENEDKSEEIEEIVMKTIKSIEGENGAAWDLIVEKCKKKGLDENAIEEALTSLMDKGLIFEPILGTIKIT